MSKYTLLKHRKLTEVFRVPEGLCDLMKDIAREVIRFQPVNVERFIADYLESMIISRELVYISQKTMNDVFDSSLQIAEILKKEGVAFEKAEIGVKIIRQEFESNFNESKHVRKTTIVNRLIAECNLNPSQAEKVTNVVEDSMEHYRERNSCCSKNISKFMHHQAVKNTINFHLRLDSLDRTSDKIEFIDENANWMSENFKKREDAATKIRSWYLGNKLRTQFKDLMKNKKENEKLLEMMRLEEAANKIRAWFLARKKRKEFETMKKSANVIKTAFRGYQVQKALKLKLDDDNKPVEN